MNDYLAIRKKLIEKDFCGMNGMQFEAVTNVNGPLLVLAGAGSGKTTVLVNRIAYLVKYGNAYKSDKEPYYTDEDILSANDFLNGDSDTFNSNAFCVDAPRPYEILAITFTNKAAGELKERIEKKLGDKSLDLWAGTFHSVCGKILRRNADRIGFSSHFTIYDTDDQKRLIKAIMKDFDIDDKMLPVKSVMSTVSHSKDSLISPNEYAKSIGNDPRLKLISEIYFEYQKRLKANDAMDFDDMISYTVELLENNEDVLDYYGNRFKYIMVDEYQDTNHAQYKLISKLSSVHNNICVVGDDDQSIYRFRGATIENILNFEDENKGAKTIRLEQNYRSTAHILNAANGVISNNRSRKGKTLWTAAGGGNKINIHTCLDERSEARFIADSILKNVESGGKFSDNAVLYRMNAQSASMENVFARSGIAYKVIGGMRFYERKEIKDVLAYLNLINNRADDIRLARIINEPKRGIGDTTVNNAVKIASELDMPLFEVFKRADEFAAIQRASTKLKEFCSMIDNLAESAEDKSIFDLVTDMLEKTGYIDALLFENTEESLERRANVEEFVSTVKQYELENDEPTLSAFLEEIALVSDIDSLDNSSDRVVLMTVHSAKGLEFDNVFLIGMEEGIFPGNQSIYGGESEIEEERRLAYVAITRAKKMLTVTNASTRMLYGSTNRNIPSRFLKEIPNECCDITSDSFENTFTYSYGESKKPYYSDAFSDIPPKNKTSPFANNTYTKPKADLTEYKAGQSVEHKTFGKGMIISARPMASDVLLEIVFDDVGTKKLMASFAKLKIL